MLNLPRIQDDAQGQTWNEHLADLMREVTRTLRTTQNRIVLRGGTAAKMGHDLPRPSRDLDIDVVGDVDVWEELRDAAKTLGITTLAKPERRSTQKGELMLSHPEAGTITVGIDIRTIRNPEAVKAILENKTANQQRGVFMYRPEILIEQKAMMACDTGVRRRAKDRYDLAWWLTTYPEHASTRARIELDRSMRSDPKLRQSWDQTHEIDPILRDTSAQTIHSVLETALQRDPVVLMARDPQGRLTARKNDQGDIELAWKHGDHKAPIGTFADLPGIEQHMIKYKAWSPEDAHTELHAIANELDAGHENNERSKTDFGPPANPESGTTRAAIMDSEKRNPPEQRSPTPRSGTRTVGD